MSGPSEYWTWPPVPGQRAGSADSGWLSDAGNVTGSLPPGSTSPNSTDAIAVPSSWPGYQPSITPLTWLSHGISTGPPVLSTTIVFGFARATASISWSPTPERLRFGWSNPSVSNVPANTTATCALLAACAAWVTDGGVLPGGSQPSWAMAPAVPP